MKGEIRNVYRVLTDEVGYLICAFCKYGSFTGSPCSEGEYECENPLQVIKEIVSENVICGGPGSDCWGFRTSYDVTLAADIVGVILANEFCSTSWHKRSDGIIEVVGVKGGKY